MREELVRVEREVRRRDDRDRVGSDERRVLGERRRVGGRLRAAMDGDLEPRSGGLHEELGDAPPLVEIEEHALARRAEREDAVEAVGGQEVDVRRDRLLVDRRPTARERGEGGGDRSMQHPAKSMLFRGGEPPSRA